MRKIFIVILTLIQVYIVSAKWRKLSLREIKYLREKIARTAISFVNKRRLIAKGKRFRFDCSGLVLAVMKANNITIFEKQAVRIRGANGVKIIYNTLKKYHKIFRNHRSVQKGDFIFFNNTYDKNRNRRLDDYLTHIAIVVDTDRDGTIKYVHRSSRGIEYGYMNLRIRHKHKYRGKIVNSFLRAKKPYDPRGTKYLSAELFYYFGSIFR